MADPLVIETTDLQKTFGTVQALRGLTLEVPAGSICGFLGRNGAGKTTTIKVLLGMTQPTSGHARVFGLAADNPQESVAIRRRTGFVSEDKELYDYMSVGEIVRFTASFYPRWDRDLEQRYLKAFDLPVDRRIKSLSLGMRTKLAVLLALCRAADLLILDEPTSGLDPTVIDEVLQALVAHVANRGATVFFSSHQIADVEQIADRVVIIDRGQAIVAGALDDLRDGYRRIQMVFPAGAPAATFRSSGIVRIHREGRVLAVLASGNSAAIVEEARKLGPQSIDSLPVSLRDIFLETVRGEQAG